MATAPVWQYDEMKFSGVDFSQTDEVAAYDNMHKKFRDYAKASEDIIRRLSLNYGRIDQKERVSNRFCRIWQGLSGDLLMHKAISSYSV